MEENLPVPLPQKFAVNVLQLIKSSQMQHGLRYRDYTRYRRYCTSRLRRLYKSLKFTHGRNKYSRRAINESTVTEARFLHVVLFTAERAWSHAMAKRFLPNEPTRPQHVYLIGRLRKAVKWATLFAQLCAVKCDARTSLEAEAYASYMKATFLFEKATNWDVALTNFEKVRSVYKMLGQYGDAETQNLCRERVEEVEPSIQYCHHVQKSEIRSSHLANNENMGESETDVFTAKLEAAASEMQSHQTTSLAEFCWLGHKFSLTDTKTQAAILKAQELEVQLHDSRDSLPVEKKLTMFDRILSSYNEARNYVRGDLQITGYAEDSKDALAGLDKAISAVLTQRNMERIELLVDRARIKFYDKGERAVKPEELVCLYGSLLQSSGDLCDLVSSARDKKPEELAFIDECMLKCVLFRVQRCFYLAKSYASAGKRIEATALYDHACNLAKDALQKFQISGMRDNSLVSELEAFSTSCKKNSCIEYAEDILKEEEGKATLANTISKMSMQYPPKDDKLLHENIYNYQSAVGASSTRSVSHIFNLPPAFQEVPCNPIVVDVAYEIIDFPPLEHRIKKEKKGIFSRLWGR